jgi:5S rRNA maturation endonuclease (ribonuclease M5)
MYGKGKVDKTHRTNSLIFKLEVYKELEKLTSHMNYSIDALIVEGPHDVKTMKLLGYEGEILSFSRKGSLIEFSDYISKKFKKVAILTDFDKEGEYLSNIFNRLLTDKRVKTDAFFRRKFRGLLKKVYLSTIESIYSLKRKM